MSEPFVGQIMMFAGNFAPRGWAFCDGQLLSISDNNVLFAILGTTYGGDGRTTFGLPDLRGRGPIHAGRGAGLANVTLGQTGGLESVTLQESQMPAHTHTATAQAASGVDVDTPTGHTWSNGEIYSSTTPDPDEALHANAIAVSNTGGSQAHENRPPYLAVNYVIALVGIFPARS